MGAAFVDENAQPSKRRAIAIVCDNLWKRGVRGFCARDFDGDDIAVAVALDSRHVSDDDAMIAAYFATDDRMWKVLGRRSSRPGDNKSKDKRSQHRRFRGGALPAASFD